MRCPTPTVTWRKVLAIIGVLVAASLITQQFVGDDEPQFSERERAVWLDLQDETLDLVVDYDDLRHLPGDWYDCTDPTDVGTTRYRVHDGGDVEIIESKGTLGPGRADSDFCEGSNGGEIASALALSADKSDHLVVYQAYRDLTGGSEEDLERLATELSPECGADEPYDATWVQSDGLGDSAYALKFSLGRGTEFVCYQFRFVRSVVEAAVTISVPAGSVSEADAVTIVRRFDAKIEARLSQFPGLLRDR